MSQVLISLHLHNLLFTFETINVNINWQKNSNSNPYLKHSVRK